MKEIYRFTIFNVQRQSVGRGYQRLFFCKCSRAGSTNIHFNCVFAFRFTQQVLWLSPDNSSIGKKQQPREPGDQNVCLQCGNWSMAQRVDVYAGWLAELLFHIGPWFQQTMTMTYLTLEKQWFVLVFWFNFQVANLIWKNHSPNLWVSQWSMLLHPLLGRFKRLISCV